MSTISSKLKTRIFTVFFMFVVTFVCISVVSAIHLSSRERVLRNETLFMKQGIMSAAGLTVPSDTLTVLNWYDACVTALPGHKKTPICYEVRSAKQGERTALVFMREGTGLWGTIEAAVGLDPTLHRVTGIAFLKQNETPGLGARIMEPWYRKHIIGKTGGLRLVGEKSGSTKPTDLDAITGATVTSKAVRDMLNTLIEDAPQLMATIRTTRDGPGV